VFGFGGWQTGTAKVVSRRLIKEWRNHDEHALGAKRRKFEFMLDVRPDDGSPRYRATCTNSSFDNVQGDEVLVLCKPAKQRVKFDADRILNPEKYHPQQPKRTKADDARWERMKDEEPGSVPPPRGPDER
jgi:hypothetical protein